MEEKIESEGGKEGRRRRRRQVESWGGKVSSRWSH